MILNILSILMILLKKETLSSTRGRKGAPSAVPPQFARRILALSSLAGRMHCRTGLRCNGLTRAGLLKRKRIRLRLSSAFIPGDIQQLDSEGAFSQGHTFSGQSACCLLLPEEICNCCDYTRFHLNRQPVLPN
jgi:hypothetical protein